MVLYYLWPVESAEMSKRYRTHITLHHMFKHLQAGLLGGCALGFLGGLCRRNFNHTTVFMDMTKALSACGVAGCVSGIPYAQIQMAGREKEDLQEEAFGLQRSCWHNRLDLLTLSGLGGGTVWSMTPYWTGFLELMGASALPRSACVLWCGMWGFIADFPLVLVGVLYLAHVDDLDFVAMKSDEDEDDD